MELLVIGCGQCGGRISDQFARLNLRARRQRGIEIVVDSFAVNTDMADLTGLSFIKRDYQHRVLIGGQSTSGHGVGKINELGAEVAREDGDKVMEAIGKTPRFLEADALLVIAGAAGGTGSGSIAVLTQQLKERYPGKPVYNLIVLPFKHEEMTEERTIYNTATCLKSAYLIADAIFLVDNQRFVGRGLSLRNSLSLINSSMVEPFYNILCAGEERKSQYVGSRTLDAGDIMETLGGWTVMGYGKVRAPGARFFIGEGRDFRKKASQAQEELQAMKAALGALSVECQPQDANKALYLLCAPPEKMNVELVREIGTALKTIATEAVIRSGDYPRARRSLGVTIVLSELTNVAKITGYFNKVIQYLAAKKKRRGKEFEHRRLEDTFKDIPSLL